MVQSIGKTHPSTYLGPMAAVNDIQKAQGALNELRQWQGELATWQTDLLFLSRMADIYGLKEADSMRRRQLTDLNAQVVQFLELAATLGQQPLKRHEEHLRKVAADQLLIRDREWPYLHTELTDKIGNLRNHYRHLRDELYLTVENLRQL